MIERVAVLGLGYVGLPVALGFARKFPGTVGFDVDVAKVEELKKGYDRNHEVEESELLNSTIKFSCDPKDLESATFYVVAVPTPVDTNNVPDLRPIKAASETVGRALAASNVSLPVVVYESTVYPGVTEEVCGPILEKVSGRSHTQSSTESDERIRSFRLGYSPERINPGDKEHTLEKITKIVSGEDSSTLERVAAAYSAIVEVGVHKAPSIKVAEAAKVIENTQRDINIALMNELALIFDLLGIRTKDVLDAAGTKWNFLKFKPGLVGGHCIGVDPYYLTSKAQSLGYHPEIILAGRRINDNVSAFIAQKLVKMLISSGKQVKGAKVGILGLTFKEDCSDLRNSKVPDIVTELRSFGIEPLIHDPLAHSSEAMHEYGLEINNLEQFNNLDGVVYAVCHKQYRDMGNEQLFSKLGTGGVMIDVKSAMNPDSVPEGFSYWSL